MALKSKYYEADLPKKDPEAGVPNEVTGKQWLDPSILPTDVEMSTKYIDAFDKEMQDHFSGAGYEHLSRILALAHSQSSTGKGKQRHATGSTGAKPWDRQPILEISRMVGPGYAAGQAMKKMQESVTMAGNKNLSAAKAEALGAIVYAAALYKLFEEME
jgi:hypothetical protein